ncbi:MAG: YidC/Oxa1 family membrane protein insertase [Planctomycetes bacterium]|nr:YidC/Oxa1 family membrane protein insertase [Planctomycetota bacterium]
MHLAIPTPDVLLNLFTNAAQAIALLVTAIAGGVATRSRYAAGTQGGGVSRWPFRVAITGLFAVAVAFLLYHLSVVDQNNQRLQTNLFRSSTEEGRKVGDQNLKQRNLGEQLEHKGAIATQELAARLARGDALHLVDVRESEEVEVGRIRGAFAKRYPDLLADPTGLVKEGHETVLLCESGNRSSELCDEFEKRGYRTRFLIGGYEKWVAEDRAIEGVPGKERDDLRSIPDYPNKQRLLDTPEVRELVAQGAIFVDVRYPGDFGLGHLPKAYNVTLRRMTTPEVAAALAALPDRPVIAVCYDKRSSFFALVFGLKWHRMGRTFLGRYTVPHEFSLPTKERDYVEAWKTEQARRTLFHAAQQPFVAALGWSRGQGVGLFAAVLLLVVGLRLLLLPLSWKADRDGRVHARLQAEFAALRQRYATDPVRAQRAVRARLRSSGLTPWRNLLASLLQVLVFVVLLAAISEHVAGHGGGWWWVEDARQPDPSGVLPWLGALLVFVLLTLLARSHGRLRLVGRAALAILLGALLLPASAAVQGYLVVSLVLVCLQAGAARLAFDRATDGRSARVPAHGVVPLRAAAALPAAGAKARRLAALAKAGLPTPEGFVVLTDLCRVDAPATRAALARGVARLRGRKLAVRSSGLVEDGRQESRAGEFLTLLEVAPGDVPGAVQRVAVSLQIPHDGGEGFGGVLVQGMIEAEWSGVLFTEDPAHSGAMLVELARGGCAAVVSGQVSPLPFRFGRVSGRPLQSATPPIDLAPLLALGRTAERLFGAPQDIEWSYAGGRFVLLQSRDVTARAGTPVSHAIEAERARLLALCADAGAQDTVFVRSELTELLPRPTPYSLALMQALWAPGGAVDLAGRRLGLDQDLGEDAPPYPLTAFGHLVVDPRQERLRFAHALQARTAWRLARGAEGIAEHFRNSAAPRLEAELRLAGAIDPARLDDAELREALRQVRVRFCTATYVEAEVVNLAGAILVDQARRLLHRRGFDAALLWGRGAGTPAQRALERLATAGATDAAWREFVREAGHRSLCDFELAEPRYAERRDFVTALVARLQGSADGGEGEAVQALPPTVALAMHRARRFAELKEEAKHLVLRELAVLRALLLEHGRRHGLGEDVFWLWPEEVEDLGQGLALEIARAIVAERRGAAEAFAAVDVPSSLRPVDIETLGRLQAHVPAAVHAGSEVQGQRVAGQGRVVGRVRILHEAEDIADVRPGEIVVARFTDPGWLPLFSQVRGLVTEVGGWLSHAAIQAREQRLPAIVGAAGAMAAFRDGELIALETDGTIQRLAERRVDLREVASGFLEVEAAGSCFQVALVDRSARGYGVRDLPGIVQIGDTVAVRQGTEVQAAVVAHRQGSLAGLFLRPAHSEGASVAAAG